MRRLLAAALPAILSLAACDPAPEAGDNFVQPAQAPRPGAPAPENAAQAGRAAEAADPALPVEAPADSPGLADMSPWQRRAYQAGYRDCRAGRYQPDSWPEAYRIGCGAAQEAR